MGDAEGTGASHEATSDRGTAAWQRKVDAAERGLRDASRAAAARRRAQGLISDADRRAIEAETAAAGRRIDDALARDEKEMSERAARDEVHIPPADLSALADPPPIPPAALRQAYGPEDGEALPPAVWQGAKLDFTDEELLARLQQRQDRGRRVPAPPQSVFDRFRAQRVPVKTRFDRLGARPAELSKPFEQLDRPALHAREFSKYEIIETSIVDAVALLHRSIGAFKRDTGAQIEIPRGIGASTLLADPRLTSAIFYVGPGFWAAVDPEGRLLPIAAVSAGDTVSLGYSGYVEASPQLHGVAYQYERPRAAGGRTPGRYYLFAPGSHRGDHVGPITFRPALRVLEHEDTALQLWSDHAHNIMFVFSASYFDRKSVRHWATELPVRVWMMADRAVQAGYFGAALSEAIRHFGAWDIVKMVARAVLEHFVPLPPTPGDIEAKRLLGIAVGMGSWGDDNYRAADVDAGARLLAPAMAQQVIATLTSAGIKVGKHVLRGVVRAVRAPAPSDAPDTTNAPRSEEPGAAAESKSGAPPREPTSAETGTPPSTAPRRGETEAASEPRSTSGVPPRPAPREESRSRGDEDRETGRSNRGTEQPSPRAPSAGERGTRRAEDAIDAEESPAARATTSRERALPKPGLRGLRRIVGAGRFKELQQRAADMAANYRSKRAELRAARARLREAEQTAATDALGAARVDRARKDVARAERRVRGVVNLLKGYVQESTIIRLGGFRDVMRTARRRAAHVGVEPESVRFTTRVHDFVERRHGALSDGIVYGRLKSDPDTVVVLAVFESKTGSVIRALVTEDKELGQVERTRARLETGAVVIDGRRYEPERVWMPADLPNPFKLPVYGVVPRGTSAVVTANLKRDIGTGQGRAFRVLEATVSNDEASDLAETLLQEHAARLPPPAPPRP